MSIGFITLLAYASLQNMHIIVGWLFGVRQVSQHCEYSERHQHISFKVGNEAMT